MRVPRARADLELSSKGSSFNNPGRTSMNTRALASLFTFLLAVVACAAETSPLVNPPPATGYNSIHVKVVDDTGRPVSGAIVERKSIRFTPTSKFRQPPNSIANAIADNNGEFSFQLDGTFLAMQVNIAFPGFAPNTCWIYASNVVQTVTLDVGASIRGRLVKNGQPVPDARIILSDTDRTSGPIPPDSSYPTMTDRNGVFEFHRLPARKSWWLYGMMNSLRSRGAVPPRQLVTPTPGLTNDVGDLEVITGVRLAGKVQTRHQEPLPSGISLSVNTWYLDSQQTTVDEEGKFEFVGLAPGQITINLRTRNWRFSGVNRSLNNLNGSPLSGLLQENKDDLLLVIERGGRIDDDDDFNGPLPRADYPSSRPLFGAESTGPVPIVLGGQVLDDATGKPVRDFKIVPGRKPPVTTNAAPAKPLLQQLTGAFRKPVTPWNERPSWNNAATDYFTNGAFTVDFQPLISKPMFRIEADGYEPFVSEPFGTNTTNLVIRLRSGNGPNGVVLQPDGKPAVGATVWYAVAREQLELTGRSLNKYGVNAGMKTTDTNGLFAFPLRPEGRKLFVAHTNGWAMLDLKTDPANLKVQLDAWATVIGTLVSSNGTPMPNVPLHLSLPNDWIAGDPMVSLQGSITTDANGRFVIADVIPGRLDLHRLVPMGNNAWNFKPQTWFICEPGRTNDLGKVVYDSPPPPPLADKVKKALGL